MRTLTVVALVLSIATAPAAAADDEQALILQVKTAQRAGLQHHDLAGYMALWTDDARIVSGRSAARGPHDLTLTRAQIGATRAIRFAGPAARIGIRWENTKATIRGDEATVTWRAITGTPKFREVVGEIYKLRRTPQGWRCYENRWWLEAVGPADKLSRFTPEVWARLDREVEQARAKADPRELAHALLRAYRLQEAHRTITGFTAAHADDVQGWILQSSLALLTGDAEGAARAARAALELDPGAYVPPWAHYLDK